MPGSLKRIFSCLQFLQKTNIFGRFNKENFLQARSEIEKKYRWVFGGIEVVLNWRQSSEIFWPLVLSLESWHMRAFCRGVICSQLTSLNSLFKSQSLETSVLKQKRKTKSRRRLDNHFVCRSRIVREINKLFFS